MMAYKDRLAALALAATMGIAWSLPAQAGGFNDFYTVHPAAVSLQYATQQVGEDCRQDAENCIDRGRINTRDLAEELCQTDDLPRDYRLALLFPCFDLADSWYIAVWDRDQNRLAECNQIRFTNRMAIFAESNRGDLREMRILSDTQNIFNEAAQGIPTPINQQLSATAVVRIAEVRDRLFEDQQMSLLAETLEGVDSGIEEGESPRCAASISTNSVLGILPEEGEQQTEAQLINGFSIGNLLIEKGRITGGRPIGIVFD